MAYQPKTITRYSEAFKMQLVQEIENGKFDSIGQARRVYGIGGAATIPIWLKKYGRHDLQTRMVRVQKPNEQDQVKKLKDEIKHLKEALADTQIQSLLNRSVYEVLCEEVGIDPDEFKKKANIQRSKKPSRRRPKKKK